MRNLSRRPILVDTSGSENSSLNWTGSRCLIPGELAPLNGRIDDTDR